MITNNKNNTINEMQYVVLEDLVPQDHLIRKIDKAIDFEFIREKVKHLYSDTKGRPSIDPVVLFKIVFIQFMFGIKSMRQTIKEIEVNMAYRWFLRIGITEEVPHFSTFGKNYKRRFENSRIFEEIFDEILSKIAKAGLIKEETIFVDSTHIKAYANKRRIEEYKVKETTNKYVAALNKELNDIREQEGKEPIKEEEKKKIVSKTDPECGMFHKGEKEKQLAYSVQTACDKHGWITGCKIHPGNINDNNGGLEFLGEYIEKHPEVENIVMDAGYTGPLLLHELIKNGKKPIIPYTIPKGKHKEITKIRFKFDKENNYYICPIGVAIRYKGVKKDGYLQYKSSKKDCKNCPYKDKCCNSSGYKEISRHLLEQAKDIAHSIRKSELGKTLYPERKKTIERVFADTKFNHTLGFTFLRGLKKNQNRCLLIFAMANVKKLALLIDKMKKDITDSLSLLLNFIHYFLYKHKFC